MKFHAEIRMIRGGGQTDANRDAHDAVHALGIPITGWCPLGDLTEDYPSPPGLLQRNPELQKTTAQDYLQKTAPHYALNKNSPQIVLASGSPRRLAILRAHGIEPLVVIPDIVEKLPEITSATELEAAVCAVALEKAYAVWKRLQQGTQAGPLPGPLPDTAISHIIAADTVVYKERILGKPTDKSEAIAMLEFLRNGNHQVFTGVAIIDAKAGTEQTLCDISTVTFGDYTQQEIEDFIDSEQPFDKAGSYALQGSWATHVLKVEGDKENVIGLPWHRIAGLL